MVKVSIPNRFQFRMMPEIRGFIFPKRGGEIHYIGGADTSGSAYDRGRRTDYEKTRR